MNGFDLFMSVLAGLLAGFGAWKGLVRILVTVVSLGAAFLVASRLHGTLAFWWSGGGDPGPGLRLIAYLVAFFGVLLAGGVAAFLLRRLLDVALLGWADRLGGALLGLAAAVLAGALIVMPLAAYTPAGESALETSVLAPYVAAMADGLARLTPPELRRRYEERMESLRRIWEGTGTLRDAAAPRKPPREEGAR